LLRAVSRGQWSDTVEIDQSLTVAPVDFAVGALFACRADLLASVGGLDERFFLYSEEEDLAKRARAMGWTAGVLPAAHAQHQETTSSAGEDGRSMAAVRIGGKLLYYRIHRGRAYATAARAIIAALVAAHGVGAVIRGRAPAYPWSLPWAIVTSRTELRRPPR
jgi:GT2 family glycosyltransferase